MSSHLVRRGGMWWTRLVVPARLRDAAGRREFIQSCKTHEVVIAKMVAAALLAGWRRQLLALEGHPVSSDILKLIGPATALATGTHLRIADAVASSGVSQSQLLQKASEGKLRLYCRVSHVPGYVLSCRELEFENPALCARGGRVMPLLTAQQRPF